MLCDPVAHSCGPAKNMDDPNARCAGTCDSNGACKGKQGQTCNTVAGGCISTAPCSPDGYCCNSQCSGPCVACDLQGLQGMCQNLPANASPHSGHSPCMGSSPCAGYCGSGATAGTCVYPTGTCGNVTCSGTANMVGVGTCNMGMCNYPAPQPCGGHFVCSNNMCKLSCTADADCASGYFCENTTCHLAATAVAAGGSHTCALLSDGSVWCWGDNYFGEIGQGNFTTTGNLSIPTPTHVPLSKTAMAIAVGSQVTYALLSDGTVFGWGANSNGQLGQGTFTISPTGLNGIPTPGKVTGLSGTVSLIASGLNHACAVISGVAWCWGSNGHCELGLGPGMCTTMSPYGIATPQKVQGLSNAVTGVTAGQAHTCVNMGGAVNCWGDDSIGAVGTGIVTSTPYATPQFLNLSTPTPLITAISANSQNTCLLSSGGVVYCWGNNFDGELGDGMFTSNNPTGTPIANGPSGPVAAMAISVGLDHSCALTQTGTVYCWGENDMGELGNGTFNTELNQDGISTPGAVTGLPLQPTAISSGSSHTCALLKNGSIWCWGYNNSSQLGDGSAINQPTPVPVTGW
jgi:alpha-tubulin suppressor-like RCC1 family protein